jgi:hypothetical protein
MEEEHRRRRQFSPDGRWYKWDTPVTGCSCHSNVAFGSDAATALRSARPYSLESLAPVSLVTR